MKCQSLFSGKIGKNISISGLLKILPRVLSIKKRSEHGKQSDPDQNIRVATHSGKQGKQGKW